MKKIFAILLMALMCPLLLQAKTNKQTVVFYVYLHCDACVNKIMKNIAYEKGVKDIVCSIENQTVTVTYDADKTDVPTLQKAFEKIGKPATTTPPDPQQQKEDAHDHDHHGHEHHQH